MNPIILPTAMGKIVGRTGFFSLGKATKENENSEFKPVKLHLKIDLVSYPAWAEGLVNMDIFNYCKLEVNYPSKHNTRFFEFAPVTICCPPRTAKKVHTQVTCAHSPPQLNQIWHYSLVLPFSILFWNDIQPLWNGFSHHPLIIQSFPRGWYRPHQKKTIFDQID